MRAACEEAGLEVGDDAIAEEMRTALLRAPGGRGTNGRRRAKEAKATADADLLSLDRDKIAQMKSYATPPLAAHGLASHVAPARPQAQGCV